MVQFIMDSNGFNSTPYFEGGLVKIGYGHTVPKTWLIKDKTITKKEATTILYKDLKKIELNPLIKDLYKQDQLLFDVCVHFIYDIGLQPFKNCKMDVLAQSCDRSKVVEVLYESVDYFENTLIKDKRLFDINVLLRRSYNKGKKNGYKKRIPKKNVGFSG